MNDTVTLTTTDLIHAHQATLNYLSSNYPTHTPHDVAEDGSFFLSPTNRSGATLLRMIATAMGKPVTSDNVIEIALYLRGC